MLQEPILVTIKGTQFKCEGFTHKVKSAFEQYMHHQMFQALKAQRNLLDDYSDHVLKLSMSVSNGLASFGSDLFYTFIKGDGPFVVLLHMCLSVHQPISQEAVKEWVDECGDEAFELFKKLMEAAKKK